MIVNGIFRDYIVHDQNNVKGFFGEYRWASNFHVALVSFDGRYYPSTENAYQAAKSFDEQIRGDFALLKPSESKSASRKIVVRDDWELVKYDVMSAVVFDKFYRHLDLREKLLATGTRYLEETNHWGDVYWGVCNGVGENNLGKILMLVRDYWAKAPQKKSLF